MVYSFFKFRREKAQLETQSNKKKIEKVKAPNEDNDNTETDTYEEFSSIEEEKQPVLEHSKKMQNVRKKIKKIKSEAKQQTVYNISNKEKDQNISKILKFKEKDNIENISKTNTEDLISEVEIEDQSRETEQNVLPIKNLEIIPDHIELKLIIPSESDASCSLTVCELPTNHDALTKMVPNTLRIKNILIKVLQGQNIIKENFVHTNYVDCVHVVCSHIKLLITLVVQRTENMDSLRQAYNHINGSIERMIDTDSGNVVIFLDGSLKVTRCIGEQFTFINSFGANVINFPLAGQHPSIIDISQDIINKDNHELGIVTNDSYHGFDDFDTNTKFRQHIDTEKSIKYYNHVKNILFS